MWPRESVLELRVEKLMERADHARGDHMRLVPALERLVQLRSASLAAAGTTSDDLQARALAGTPGAVSGE